MFVDVGKRQVSRDIKGLEAHDSNLPGQRIIIWYH